MGGTAVPAVSRGIHNVERCTPYSEYRPLAMRYDQPTRWGRHNQTSLLGKVGMSTNHNVRRQRLPGEGRP